MKISNPHTHKTGEAGITLLITLLLMGVLLGVSTSLLNLTLKQYQLAGIALSSETAFQAANAGLECILFHDLPATGDGIFAVQDDGFGRPPVANVSCMQATSNDLAGGNNSNAGDELGEVESGEEQRFQFTWGSDPQKQVCSEVSIYKFSSASAQVPVQIGTKAFRTPCPAGSVCTVVQARGYNVSCAQIGGSLRVVEREYTQVY